MKINLGAGQDIRPGQVNVDIRALPGIDVVADARALPFEDHSADEILAQDLLEHFPPDDVPSALREWKRVLKPGGSLLIRTPDFFKIFRSAIARQLPERDVFYLLFGDQSGHAGGTEWGSHKFGASISQLRTLLQESGFVDIVINDHPHEFNLYAMAVTPALVPDASLVS